MQARIHQLKLTVATVRPVIVALASCKAGSPDRWAGAAAGVPPRPALAMLRTSAASFSTSFWQRRHSVRCAGSLRSGMRLDQRQDRASCADMRIRPGWGGGGGRTASISR